MAVPAPLRRLSVARGQNGRDLRAAAARFTAFRGPIRVRFPNGSEDGAARHVQARLETPISHAFRLSSLFHLEAPFFFFLVLRSFRERNHCRRRIDRFGSHCEHYPG